MARSGISWTAERCLGGEEGKFMPAAPQDIISRYFAAQVKRDTDTLVALFTDDAGVVDEGRTRRETSEIRAWRAEVTTAYQYTTEVLDVQPVGDGDYLARVAWWATSQAGSSSSDTSSPSTAIGSVDWRSHRELR